MIKIDKKIKCGKFLRIDGLLQIPLHLVIATLYLCLIGMQFFYFSRRKKENRGEKIVFDFTFSFVLERSIEYSVTLKF
jgi:hypothetical protein